MDADALPAGDLRYVYLHWTAGDYATTFAAYHVCVGFDGSSCFVRKTADLRANMRDVRLPGPAYAAHTAGRNSFAIGVAVCGMAAAEPDDFGAYPLRADALALTLRTVKELCAAYAIPVDARHVRTHAEAAVEDGYFGCGDGERWDIARLEPRSRPLVADEATRLGDTLRARIASA